MLRLDIHLCGNAELETVETYRPLARFDRTRQRALNVGLGFFVYFERVAGRNVSSTGSSRRRRRGPPPLREP